MDKNNLIIVSIVAVIAIIGMFIMTPSISRTSDFSYANTVESDLAGHAINTIQEPVRRDTIPNVINAHSCNADDICEVNDLDAIHISGVKGGVDSSWFVGSLLSVRNAEGSAELLADSITSRYLNVSANIFSGVIYAQALKTVGPITSGGYLAVMEAVGEGNAYACFDEDGHLFRSDTPCVQTNTTTTTYNNQDILNMLNSCKIGQVSTIDNNAMNNKLLTCEEMCDYYDEQNIWGTKPLTCIGGFYYSDSITGGHQTTCYSSHYIGSGASLYTVKQCVCCSS